MMRFCGSALLAMTLCAAAPPALAVFIFRVGDTVYVDGKQYRWEEWKKVRDTYQPEAPAPTAPQAATPGPRAASCVSSIYYDEFPSDDDRFSCSAGLGALTRDEILKSGWKIDLIEKIPSPAGSPQQSPRGLPLSLYKLVISRDPAVPALPVQQRAEPATARKALRREDSMCMDDCLGLGGLRSFCQERCTN
jgi:hypothetical protein